MRRIVVIAALIVPLVGCFEAESNITLANDGSGAFSTAFSFSPKVVELFHTLDAMQPDAHMMTDLAAILPHKPTPAEKKQLKAAGITSVKAESTSTNDTLEASVSANFKSPQSLLALTTLTSAAPEVTLQAAKDGAYSFHMGSGGGVDGGMAEKFQSPPVDLKPEDSEKLMSMAMGMMDEMVKFKLAVHLELPGTISEATPEIGRQIEANTVTWTLDGATLMAMAGSFDREVLKDGYTAVFTLPPGKQFPNSVLQKPARPEHKGSVR